MQVGFLWMQKVLFLLIAKKAKNANDNSRKTCRIVKCIHELWDDNAFLVAVENRVGENSSLL